MESENNFKKHYLCLALLFILGNAIIIFPPKNADKYNFLAFLLSGLVSVLAFLFGRKIKINKATVFGIILLAMYCIFDAFIAFIQFIRYDLLGKTAPFLIVLSFILVLIYISFQKTNMLYKFSLLAGILSLLVVLVFFLSTLKEFEIENIIIREFPNLKALLQQFLPYLKGFSLPMILLGLFSEQENIKASIGVFGVVLGLVVFMICLLNTVLLFGIEFSGLLDYPYASAGSTVTFGNLFTRLDGLIYFVYLTTCIVKCLVGVLVIKKAKNPRT